MDGGENGSRLILEKVTECGSCQQDPSHDRDLLPERGKLRWRVWKQQRDEPVDPPPGGMWYRVDECALCYETRRRFFGISLAAMDEERKNPEVSDDFIGKRRKRARGEDKFAKKEGNTAFTTTYKDSQRVPSSSWTP